MGWLCDEKRPRLAWHRYGAAVVVTCRGTFQTDSEPVTMKFMRVWLKQNGRWQIIAGSVSKA